MAKNKKKGNSKPQFGRTNCVFCGNKRALTEEHIFSDWIKTVLPRTGPLKHPQLLTSIYPDADGVVYIEPTIKQRQGHFGNQRVKIVCGPCNNGWMNQIEEKSRPILTSLILGQSITLSQDDHHHLCKWAILKTIVAEYTDLPFKVISKEDRENFMASKALPSLWKIWIGRYSGNDDGLRYHHTGAIVADPLTELLNPPKRPNTQFSVFFLNRLVIYTFATSHPLENYSIPIDLAQKMHPILPNVQPKIIWENMPPLSEEDYQALVRNHQRLNLL